MRSTDPRPFWQVVAVAAMAVLLALGVTAEVSGARAPDLELYPPLSGGLGPIDDDGRGCEWLDPTYNGRTYAANVFERAQRERIRQRRVQLDCGTWDPDAWRQQIAERIAERARP